MLRIFKINNINNKELKFFPLLQTLCEIERGKSDSFARDK